MFPGSPNKSTKSKSVRVATPEARRRTYHNILSSRLSDIWHDKSSPYSIMSSPLSLPIRAGEEIADSKSTFSNNCSDIESMPSEYHPACDTRFVDFWDYPLSLDGVQIFEHVPDCVVSTKV